jgi:hypothetical protein
MEELAALQKKFLDIQKGSGFKLSERTVVDIIQKVLDRGKIKLIFTNNGKEYVTEEKISKEISDEIKKHKGRLEKVDLIKLLDVPSGLIDSRVNLLLQKDKSLSIIEGKIISNQYLDEIVNEINEQLKFTGVLGLPELSNRYDLSIDFFKRFLKDRLGSFGGAKLFPTRLLTQEYIEEQKQRVRPVLLASTTPINYSTIIENYKIDEMIIDEVIKGLINAGVVRGRVVSNTFEPFIYEESRINYVKGVILHNNFLEYDKLKSIGIKNCKEYIKDLQKKDKNSFEGIYLKEYFITNNLKNNFEYVFFDNYSKGYNTNLTTIFSFELHDEDVLALLDSINVKANSLIILNMNLIPVNFINTFVEELTVKLKDEASKQYNTFVSKIKKEVKKEEPKDKKGKKSGGKGKGKKDFSDDEEDSSENYIRLTPQFKEQIKTSFLKSPQFDDVHEKDETLETVFEKFTMPKIIENYSKFINEFIKSKSQNTADPKLLMNQIETEFHILKIIQKAIENLSKLSTDTTYQSSIKAIVVQTCKKDLNNLFKNILTYQLIHMKSKIDLNKLNNPADRKDIINTFTDTDLKEIFNVLNDNVQNKNLVDFMTVLQTNSKNLAVSLMLPDKKKEKALIDSYNQELSKSIEEKMAMLGKQLKKDYIALAVDIGLHALLKKGHMLKLPYELWAISICLNILGQKDIALHDTKALLTTVNEIVSLSDDEFAKRENEISEYFNKLYNSY